MYDEIALTPIGSEEAYSRLRATQTKIRPGDDLTRRADINQNTTKGEKQTSTNEAPPSNTKVATAVLITMIAILLILMRTLIALSVAIFSRLMSEQSKLASQLENLNQDTRSELNLIPLIQIQNNISQMLAQLDDRGNELIDNPNEDKIEFNLTQFIQIQNNISQTLTQLDDRVNDFILTQLKPQSQSQCGPGLWWRVAYLDMTEPLQQCPSAWSSTILAE